MCFIFASPHQIFKTIKTVIVTVPLKRWSINNIRGCLTIVFIFSKMMLNRISLRVKSFISKLNYKDDWGISFSDTSLLHSHGEQIKSSAFASGRFIGTASLRHYSDMPSSLLRGTGTVEYVFQSAVNKNVPEVYWVSLAHSNSTKTLCMAILWAIEEALQRERERERVFWYRDELQGWVSMSTSRDGIDVSGFRFCFVRCLWLPFLS